MADNEAFKKMKDLAAAKKKIQQFNTEADETNKLINEFQVQTQKKDHEYLVDDLSDLQRRVSALEEKVRSICDDHPDHENDMKDKLAKIEETWTTLTETLKNSFLSDAQNLVSWFKKMERTIVSCELAKDFKGAEEVLEKHQQYKDKIDGQEESFVKVHKVGEMLLEKTNIPQLEIQEQLNVLSHRKTSLLEIWEENQNMYNQCLSLLTFYSKFEDVETWLKKQEAFLENEDVGDSLSATRALLKRHEEFEENLAAQAVKIQALDDFAQNLITGNHYAMNDLSQMREVLSLHKEALLGMAACTGSIQINSNSFPGKESGSTEEANNDLDQHKNSGQNQTEESDNRWDSLLKMAQDRKSKQKAALERHHSQNDDKTENCTEASKPISKNVSCQNSTSASAPKLKVEGLGHVIASLIENRKKLDDMIDQIGDTNPQLLESILAKKCQIDEMLVKFNA